MHARRWVMEMETMPGEQAVAASRVRLELGTMFYLIDSTCTYDRDRRVIVARFTLEAPTMRIAARVGYAAFTRALKRAGLEPLLNGEEAAATFSQSVGTLDKVVQPTGRSSE